MARGGPSVADTDRARGGAFASLLDRSAESDAALDALVFAYESLETPERRALIAAVACDAARPAPALAALLTVEQDPVLRSRLGALLRDRTRLERSAVAWGTLFEGGAALVQQVGGAKPEALTISWRCSEINDMQIKASGEMTFPEPCREADLAATVDAIVPMLWTHIRCGGALPPGVERFSGFFTLARAEGDA